MMEWSFSNWNEENFIPFSIGLSSKPFFIIYATPFQKFSCVFSVDHMHLTFTLFFFQEKKLSFVYFFFNVPSNEYDVFLFRCIVEPYGVLLFLLACVTFKSLVFGSFTISLELLW
jgi:hypothetical protein